MNSYKFYPHNVQNFQYEYKKLSYIAFLRMLHDNHSDIVTNPDLLSEDYIPSEIPARESQINELLFCISPLNERKPPINVWVYGKPGSGKTGTCKLLLKKLEHELHIHSLYINCWENNTFFAVLDNIVRQLRILGAERLHTSFKLERLKKYFEKRSLVLVLDEIDMPNKRERNDILYNFSMIPRLQIICISNNKYALFGLDDRIKSRLNPKQLEFLPYSEDDLMFILKQRAEFALSPTSYDNKSLRLMASLAEGDARVATQILRTAAYLADKQGCDRIDEIHVKLGYFSVKNMKRIYMLSKLTVHHRLLFEILQAQGPLKSGDFWRAYIQKCQQLKVKHIAERTYNLYIKKLADMGLIRAKRALIRGQVREYSVA